MAVLRLASYHFSIGFFFLFGLVKGLIVFRGFLVLIIFSIVSKRPFFS